MYSSSFDKWLEINLEFGEILSPCVVLIETVG